MSIDAGAELDKFNAVVRDMIMESVSCEIDWWFAQRYHPADAEFRAYGSCPSCDKRRTRLVCAHCADTIATGKMHCSDCGHRGAMKDFFYKLERLF